MRIVRDDINKLPPIDPSNRNGSKGKKVPFDQPNARLLPEYPKPAARGKNASAILPGISTQVGQAHFHQVYQILINFIRDSSGGEKHGS